MTSDRTSTATNGRRLVPYFAGAGLALASISLAWRLGEGPEALAYLALYALTFGPGLPIGFALFGRRHAAGWIAGALIGYAATAVILWATVQLRVPALWAGVVAWAITTAVSFYALRRVGPLVDLPQWKVRDTTALLVVLLAVPLLIWKPFTNIGAIDTDGSRRYRAYFTADFFWHIALTAELARAQSPPRNPYLARRPLHYYWAYFVPPAAVARTGLMPSVQACLAVNASCAATLFVAAIFVFAWCAVPRAGPVAAATSIALAGASAEGLHAMWTLWQRGQPLEGLRALNIDAITAWFLRGLTVDGLPRSLWYTPQHAAACALSLVALVVPAAARPGQPITGLLAGTGLGLALIFSPFLGGAFSLVYGLVAVWVALRARREAVANLVSTVPAAVPVIAAFTWCVGSGTFEGAGGAVALGLSRLAAAAPLAAPILALGPLLAVALPAVAIARGFRTEAAIVALATGLAMFYFVTLTSEPIWIGWRAGQILLVPLPGRASATIAALIERGWRTLAAVAIVAIFAVGLPTTLIDAYNAQDVRNTEMGPGFRWTVVVSPDTQAAVDWIRRTTPRDTVVQMSIAPRGRETWSLIPTFAERRMAAGQPISLLRVPEYDTLSAQVDELYRAADAAAAAQIARKLRIDYVYVDQVERDAFGDPAIAKFGDLRYFSPAFTSGAAAVYAVR